MGEWWWGTHWRSNVWYITEIMEARRQWSHIVKVLSRKWNKTKKNCHLGILYLVIIFFKNKDRIKNIFKYVKDERICYQHVLIIRNTKRKFSRLKKSDPRWKSWLKEGMKGNSKGKYVNKCKIILTSWNNSNNNESKLSSQKARKRITN